MKVWSVGATAVEYVYVLSPAGPFASAVHGCEIGARVCHCVARWQLHHSQLQHKQWDNLIPLNNGIRNSGIHGLPQTGSHRVLKWNSCTCSRRALTSRTCKPGPARDLPVPRQYMYTSALLSLPRPPRSAAHVDSHSACGSTEQERKTQRTEHSIIPSAAQQRSTQG